jgi:hypothetical protein
MALTCGVAADAPPRMFEKLIRDAVERIDQEA